MGEGPDNSAVAPVTLSARRRSTAPSPGVLEPALSTTDASTTSLRLARSDSRAVVEIRPESRATVDIRPEWRGFVEIRSEWRAVVEMRTEAARWPGRSCLGFVDSHCSTAQLGAVEPSDGYRNDRRVAELHEREPARPPRRPWRWMVMVMLCAAPSLAAGAPDLRLVTSVNGLR